jgi:UDP-N-acetylmuramate dehydrogenase
MEVEVPTIKDVSNAVIKIRQSKLPNPAEIGNAGSFFKNPVIGIEHLNHLISLYPNIVYYPVNEEEVKVAAGWLIDSLGWKGKTFGNYGVHKNQALVLVNYGGAKGKDILNLSEQIIQEVMEKYNIRLEREVNIY